MTLASMHLVFQVPVDSTITLHPIMFGKSAFTYSCAHQAEVAINVELKLQIQNCRSYWNLEVSIRVPKSSYVLFTKCNRCVLWHTIFEESFTVKGGKFAKQIFVKCHQIKTKQKIKKLTAKMRVDSRRRLQYWTLGPLTLTFLIWFRNGFIKFPICT